MPGRRQREQAALEAVATCSVQHADRFDRRHLCRRSRDHNPDYHQCGCLYAWDDEGNQVDGKGVGGL